jgi:peptidoglycan-associated lipoprotein
VATTYEPVYFGYDSSSVTTGETYKVQQVAQHLNANPRHAVIVQGHTDERGSREYNLALGERRALAVRQVLMSLGISPDRIQTLSYGEEMPAVPGFDESAWSMNRRAEFQLMQ